MDQSMNKDEQELMMKLSVFEQQIRQLQEQAGVVENAIVELSSLNFDLNELMGAKNKEIFAGVGKGIFVKGKLISEDLIVDIGSKNFVKKTIPETKKLIETQIKKLEDVKNQIIERLEDTNKELTNFFNDVQKRAKTKKL